MIGPLNFFQTNFYFVVFLNPPKNKMGNFRKFVFVKCKLIIFYFYFLAIFGYVQRRR
jgi:hypothetical protein